VPENVNLNLHIGICHAQLKQFDQAKATFDRVLSFAPQNLNAFVNIFNTWLRHKRQAELNELIVRMKALTNAPGAFYVELIESALEASNKAVAEDLMRFVEEKFAQDDQAMIELAMCYSGSDREAQGVNLLRQVLERNPGHIEAHIRLGVLYYEMKQTRLAKRHWDLAEAEAKRQNDQMMLYEIKTTRDHYLHGRRVPQNMFDFFTQMPSGLLDELLKNAPPEIAKMIRNNPEMLKTMFGDMAGFNEGDFYG
jgi:Tfp pilus assembly protein PilF